jgi:hypothetical protein
VNQTLEGCLLARWLTRGLVMPGFIPGIHGVAQSTMIVDLAPPSMREPFAVLQSKLTFILVYGRDMPGQDGKGAARCFSARSRENGGARPREILLVQLTCVFPRD